MNTLVLGWVTLIFFLYLLSRNEIKFKKQGLSKKVSHVFIFDKLIETVGHAMGAFAITIAPVALVSIVSSVQPFFVFLFGVILTIFFPHIIKEDMRKRIIIVKIVSMIVMFAGIILLTL